MPSEINAAPPPLHWRWLTSNGVLRSVAVAIAARPRIAIGIIVVALAIAAATVAARKLETRGGTWAPITRGDLVTNIEVDGELEAINADVLGPPQSRDVWMFKITMLAPEGKDVKKGEPVLAFDTTDLMQTLQQEMSDSASARTEIEKLRADLALQDAQDKLALAQAEATLHKSELKLEAPANLRGRAEQKQIELDHALALREVTFLKDKIRQQQASARERLEIQQTKLADAERRVGEIRTTIERMTVTAPRDGTVVYRTERGEEKNKVGDQIWRGARPVEIPDLRTMRGQANAAERDAGKVREGQKIVLRLDAVQDREFRGTIEYVAKGLVPNPTRRGIKILPLRIKLDSTDPKAMRPGMRYRGDVEISRRKNALLIPVEAIHTDAAGTFVTRKSLFGSERVDVKLGARSSTQAIILSGLDEDDEVLLPQDESSESENGEAKS